MSQAQDAALPPELAELQAVAAAMDADTAGASLVPGQEPPPPVDRGAEVAAMVQLLVQAAAPIAPFLPDCYPPAWCEQFGTALAAVAEKRGWNLDVSSPELALAVITVPATAKAVVLGRAYFAAKKAQAEAQQRAPAKPAPAAAPVPASWPPVDADDRPHAGERVMPGGC